MQSLFLLQDTASIFVRMKAFRDDLSELEGPSIVRFPASARDWRQAGYQAALVGDLLNWELGFDFARPRPSLEREFLAEHPLDLDEILEYERLLAPRQGKAHAAKRARAVAVETGRRFLSYARCYNPKFIFLWNGWTLPYSIVKALARESGAFCVCAERGLIPNTLVIDTEGVNAGSYICGEKWEAIASAPPTAREREIAAEYCASYRTARQSVVNAAGNETSAKTLPEIPEGMQTILCPEQLDWDSNTVLFSPECPTNRSMLETLAEATQGKPYFVLFKQHPEADRDSAAYEAILGSRGAVISKDTPLHTVLEAADIVVTRNSTVGFEALLLGKPVVTLGRSLYSHKGFTYDAEDMESLRNALAEAAPRKTIPKAGEDLWQRFLAYLLTRYHYYMAPTTDWQKEANAAKRKFLLDSIARSQPDWGKAKPREKYRWEALFSITDEAADLGKRILLRAGEHGVDSPDNILLVRACPPEALAKSAAGLRQACPKADLFLAERGKTASGEEAELEFAGRFLLNRPYAAARLFARKWDLAIFAVLNAGWAPSNIGPLTRLIRAPVKLVVDDYARILAL